MAEFIQPRTDDRILILGMTGSGKTCAAVWHLSLQDIDRRPWIIIDYKGDELINGIERAETMEVTDEIPELPGIYIVRVLPGDEPALSELFKRIWMHENVGVYVDEGFMIDPRDRYFNACLTQGRSKNVTMIVLTQRPAWVSRFLVSESSFFQVFRLSDDSDIDRVKAFIKGKDKEMRKQIGTGELDEFWSHYYSVKKNALVKMSPVPTGEKILTMIDAKLPRRRRRL